MAHRASSSSGVHPARLAPSTSWIGVADPHRRAAMRSANPKGRRSVTPSGSSSKSSRATSISAAPMTTRLPNSSIGASARVVVAITSQLRIRQALHDLRKGLGAIIGKERKIGHHHQRGVLVGFKHRLGQHPRIQIPQEAGRRAAQPEYVLELEHHRCVLKCERRLAEPRRRDDKAQGAAILEEPRQKARSAPQAVGNHSVGAPPLASALLDETGHGHLLLLSALANNRSHLTRPRLSGQPARNIRPPIPFHCRPDKPPATCRQPRKRHPQAQGTREEGPRQASPVICGKAPAPFALRASDKQSNGTRATGPRRPLAPPAESRQRPLPPQEGRRRQEIRDAATVSPRFAREHFRETVGVGVTYNLLRTFTAA